MSLKQLYKQLDREYSDKLFNFDICKLPEQYVTFTEQDVKIELEIYEFYKKLHEEESDGDI